LEIVLATTIDTANEDQRPRIVAIAGLVAQNRSVVIVVARRGHEAKRVTGARLLTEIMSCSVNREDVEQHHLTRSELDVHGLAFIHFTFVDRDPKNQVVAFLPDVVSRLLCRMRSRQKTQAAVRAHTVEDGYPHGGRGKRLDGGMAGVAMPWRGGPGKRALVEDAGAPEDDVGTDDLLNDVHDVGMGGVIQPAGARFEAFEAASRYMRTHHVVIGESRIVFNQLQGQRLELGDVLFRQPVRRNDETVAMIGLDLVRAKDWMGWWHLNFLYSRAGIPAGAALTLPADVEGCCRLSQLSWRLRDRFVVLGHNLLVRFLGSRVAQDHALERVGDDLMEGRLDDGVVHLAAADFDELRPGALI